MKYEYMKTNLNSPSDRRTDITLLNEAGNEGWRLVWIAPNFTGYFIREIPEPKPAKRSSKPSV